MLFYAIMQEAAVFSYGIINRADKTIKPAVCVFFSFRLFFVQVRKGTHDLFRRLPDVNVAVVVVLWSGPWITMSFIKSLCLSYEKYLLSVCSAR